MSKASARILSAVNLLLFAVSAVMNYMYQASGFPFKLKLRCSAVFVLLAVINLAAAAILKSKRLSFSCFIAAGAAFAFAGDVLIMRNFINGAAAFAAGHVCFLVAYCLLQKIKPLDLLLGGVIFLGATTFLLFYPRLYFGGTVLKAACIAYALVISLMLGKAFGNFIRSRSLLTALLLLGSALFFFSDTMLALHCFGYGFRSANSLCSTTYYPAMCLLSASICVNLLQKPSRNIA